MALPQQYDKLEEDRDENQDEDLEHPPLDRDLYDRVEFDTEEEK